MPSLRVALAQVNPTVGDLAGNQSLVRASVEESAARGAQLVVLPEMVLTGYPIEDLAFRASFIEASRTAVASLARDLADDGLGDIAVVVGFLDQATQQEPQPWLPKNLPQNAVAVLYGGQVVATQAKHHLWNYGVGDEVRNFVAGDTMQIVRVRGVDVAIAICEDLWQDGPSAVADQAEAALLVVPNGSPYERNKDDVRLELCSRRAREGSCALAYVNLAGGQDELVFDGDSLVVDADGQLLARARQFEPELLVVDLELPGSADSLGLDELDQREVDSDRRDDDSGRGDERMHGLRVERTVLSESPPPTSGQQQDRERESTRNPQPPAIAERLSDLAEIYAALVTGSRDYVRKNGFRSVLLGLSGGIDSALAATIAVDALGADAVFAVSNPSAWSTDHSRSDAAELARRTGLHFDTVPIATIVDAFNKEVYVNGLAEENLQARVRAVLWMALSNQHGHLVLACGNKSELATGYSTIYGDAVGGFAPLKDVPKTLVWQLARWRNQNAVDRGGSPPIPEQIIAKPPSAELRPGQLDTDSLPPYELLDLVLDAYVERDLGSADLLQAGFDPDLVRQVVTLVDRAEYKRRQYPPGPKISARNFGRDRRVPITNAWREQTDSPTTKGQPR